MRRWGFDNRCWPGIALLCLLGLMDVARMLPIDQEPHLSQEEVQFAEEYLRRFYHLGEEGGRRSKRGTAAFEDKVRDMQNFFGLEPSGDLDAATLAVMKKARCGVPDVENYGFYPDKPRWKNRTITYRIETYTPDLRREDVEMSFRLALKIWSDTAPLNFMKVDRGQADIMISFGSRDHGDFFPFDGPRGVLAHAFEPGEDLGGDIHFDEDEIWTMGHHKRGYNLFTVAAHELGHSLGLSHSKDPSALMYPNYKYYNMARYALPLDDRLGIQALYGSHSTRKQDTLPTPEKCNPALSIDAVAMIGQELVFFKNRHMWLRSTWMGYWTRIREGPTSSYLPSILSPVDAAYDIPKKGVSYIFTGPKYWVVQQLNMKSHYGSIYDYGFPGTVKRIDAAVHLTENGKTYFFVGNVYYRYDEAKSAMDPGFPRSIAENWLGISRKVDAALELSGYVHIFSGSKAYKYDYRKRRVLYTVNANAWLGC